MLRNVALFLMIAAVSVAVGQQNKPSRTISYFTKNDPKYGKLLAALGEEPTCATVDVNVHADDTKIDEGHETWWLLASPKGNSEYKKYPYVYVLEPPGTLTLKDIVLVISDKTSRGLARRICSEVAGTTPGARIHLK